MGSLPIQKTYKLYINGQFPRTESGRYYAISNTKNELLANVCLASRKDFRNAVVAARSASTAWSERAAFNRGQILYRIAEMMEGRREQFVQELIAQGSNLKSATQEVQQTIDCCVYYSGWCDKYQQMASSVNPVASSHFNFSVNEPMGVVAIIAPETTSLLGFVSVVMPAIAGGNTCIVLASELKPLCSITFAEVLATSDMPNGVINILTGSELELHPHFSSHMDVNAIVYCRENSEHLKVTKENASINVKRSFHWNADWSKIENQHPYWILDLQEIKTTWHPIENIGITGAKY
jgi:acyl-CoA reductase-like NAD-dependent aldehyde dehydrogenase